MLGMPVMPIALFMFFELPTYGVVAGYLGYSRKLNVYVALVAAMVAGRCMSLLVMNIAIRAIGMRLPPIFGTIGIFSAGIPGMIIQIILVPVLVAIVRRVANGNSILSLE